MIMKRYNNILKSFLAIIIAIQFSGCDDFLDINQDPNNPLSVPEELLLTSAQIDIAGALGMSSGGLSQITSSYVHQIVQRGATINDYGVLGNDFGVSTPWNVLYTRGLQDVEVMIAQSYETESYHYAAIGQILKAYSFSLLVDVYGDVPYFEAFLGAENIYPKYDEGSLVYAECFALLDTALLNITKTPSKIVGVNDLVYNGNMDKWTKLAKTIKLKLYNQVRLVQNVTAEVNALILEGDLLDDSSDDFELPYGSAQSPDDRNPGWVQEYSNANPQYYVSPYFFETMQNINTFGHRDYGNDIGAGNIVDPRVPYYFFNQLPVGSADGDAENPCSYCPSRSGTGFLSIWQFSFNIDPNEGFDQAISQTAIGLYPIGGAFDDGMGSDGGIGPTFGVPSTPQRLLTSFARKYIEAELYLTGAATGDARVALDEAMRLSFAKVNDLANTAGVAVIADADIDTYVNGVLTGYDAADDAGKLEHIMTQKWIASFGFAVDSFTDYRRTGWPTLHDGNTDDLAFTVRGRDYPNSFPWVATNLNTNANAPTQKIVTSAAAKPFWMN